MTTLEFYFDISCPYAYLASTQVESLCARYGAALEWRPVLLGGIFRAHQTPQLPVTEMPAAKARHNAQDLARWSEVFGVPLKFPPKHPIRTVDALRLLLVAPEAVRAPLTHALYRCYWVDGRRVDDRAVLSELADEAGLDGAALLAGIDAPEVKQELRDRTDRAVRRGVFGVPTCFVDGAQFWGQDRLYFVEQVLAGRRVPGLADLPDYNLHAAPLAE